MNECCKPTFLQRLMGLDNHDWETVEATHYSQLETKLSNGAINHPSHGQLLERKVCLTCGKIVDTISPAIVEINNEIKEKEDRLKRAKDLYNGYC